MKLWLGAALALLLPITATGAPAAEAKRGAVCKLFPAKEAASLAECRGGVHSRLPAFVFKFIGRRMGADRRIATKIEIRRSDRAVVLQTLARPGWDIEVPAAGSDGTVEEKGALEFHELADLPFALVDVNFDGYADIRVASKAARGCTVNHYWLFDPAAGRFGGKRDEATMPMGGLQCGTVRFDPMNREVVIRRQAVPYHLVTIETGHRWRGDKLVRRRARVEIVAKSGRCRARIYIYFGDKPRGTGFRSCPREADGGNRYSPPDGDLAKTGTFDKWLK